MGTRVMAAPSDGLAKLVDGLLERADEYTDILAARICTEVAEHAGGCVPMEDIRESCRAELRNVLQALAGRAPLDTEVGAETGRRRAQQNVPEAELLASYRLGIRLVWELVIKEAAATGLVDHEALVGAATSIWAIQDKVIESTITGHREATGERLRAAEQERSALLEALLTGQSLAPGELRSTVDVLWMPRYGRFVVVAAEVSSVGRHPLARTEQALRRAEIHSVWHLRPEVHVGIVHLPAPRRLGELVEVLEGEAVRRIGVSPVYDDLYETGVIVRFAEIAMLSGRAGGCAVSTFDDNPLAMAVSAAPEITRRLARDIFGPLLALPEPERNILLDTLETWLAAGGSTEETAKRMYCHPNTVRLRMRRISERTGRSMSEPKGIAELSLALHAVRQTPETGNVDRC